MYNNQSTEWAIGTEKDVEGYKNGEKVYPLPKDEIVVINENGDDFLEVTVGGVKTRYESADMFSFVANGDLSFLSNGTVKAYAIGNQTTSSNYSDWKIGYGGMLLDEDKTLASETKVTIIFDWDNSLGLHLDFIVSDLIIGSRSLHEWEIPGVATEDSGYIETVSGRFANEIASGYCAFKGLRAQDDTTRESIENLNTREVTTFYEMFKDSLFDGNLSNWKINYVLDMTRMFQGATEFKGDGENEGDGESLLWNVSNVEKLEGMFQQAISFNGDLSGWDVEYHEEEPEGWRVGATNWIGRAFCNDGQPRWGTDGTGECDFYIAMNVESKMFPFGDVDDLEIIDTIKIEYHVTNLSRRDKLQLNAFEANGGTWDRNEIYPGELAIYTTEVPIGYHFIKIVGIDYGSQPPRSVEWEQAGEVAPIFEDEIIVGGEIAPDCIEVIRNNMRTIYCDEHLHKFEVNDFATIQFPTRTIEIIKVDDGEWKFPEDVTNEEIRNAKKIEAVFDWDNSIVRADLSWIKSLTQIGGRSPNDYEQPAPGTRAKTPTWIAGQLKRGPYAFKGLDIDATDVIDKMDVSNLSNLKNMFESATYNGNLNNWDVSKISNMSYMFFASTWNNGAAPGEDGDMVGGVPNVLTWDVSNVFTMQGMFESNEAFNAQIDNWNTSTLHDVTAMFRGAKSFNRDLSEWFAVNMPEEPEIFDQNAIKWVNVWCNEGRPRWGTDGTGFCEWEGIIDGESLSFEDFTILETTGAGGTITLPTAWEDCVYLNFNDGTNPVNVKYEVQNGADPDTFLKRDNDAEYTITAILAWDNELNKDLSWLKDVSKFGKNGASGNKNQIKNARYAFAGLPQLSLTALTNLDITNHTDVSHMFDGSATFSQQLNFNTHNVEVADYMFADCVAFNEDISAWDVSGLGSAVGMFKGATTFSSSLADWDVRELMHMSSMFEDAEAFNSEIGAWETLAAEEMDNMFKGATSFYQNLSSWDVENIDEEPEGFDEGATAWTITEVEFNRNGTLKTAPAPDMCNYGRPRWGTDGTQLCEIDINSEWVHRVFPTTYGTIKHEFLVRITNASFEHNVKIYTSKDGTTKVGWAKGETADSLDYIDENPTIAPFETIWFYYRTDPGYDEIEFWAVDEENGGNKDVPSDRVIHQYRSGTITDDAADAIVEQADGSIYVVRDGFSNYYSLDHMHTVINIADKEIQMPVPSLREELQAIKVGDYWYFDNIDGDLPVGWTHGLHDIGSTPDLSGHAFTSTPSTSGEIKFVCDWDNSTAHNDLSWIGAISNIGICRETHHSNEIKNGAYAFHKAQMQTIEGLESLGVTYPMSLTHMFAGCTNFNQSVQGINTELTSDLSYMFADCINFDGAVAGLRTQNVTSMSNMFKGASKFNQNIDWDTRDVVTFDHMFDGATLYNSMIFSNTISAERMSGMFKNAKSFNRPLGWNVKKVVTFADMFDGASAFNQDLSGWDVQHITSHVPDFDKDATNWKGESYCNRGRPRWGVNPATSCLPTAQDRAVVKAIALQTYKIDNTSINTSGFAYYTQLGNAAPVKVSDPASFKFNESLAVNGKTFKVLVGENDSQPGFFPSTTVMVSTLVEERAYDNSCVIREYDCNCGQCNCGHFDQCGQTCHDTQCNCRENCWTETVVGDGQTPYCPDTWSVCYANVNDGTVTCCHADGRTMGGWWGGCPGGWYGCHGAKCCHDARHCNTVCDTCRTCNNNHCCIDTCCERCQEKGKCGTPANFTDKFGYWFRIENPGNAAPVTASVDTFVQQETHGTAKENHKLSSYEKLAAQFENWVTLNLNGLPAVDGGQNMIVYLQEQTIEEKKASKVFVEVYNKNDELVDVDDNRYLYDNKYIYIHYNEGEEGFSYVAEISNGEDIIATYNGTFPEEKEDGTIGPYPKHPLPNAFVAPTERKDAEYATRLAFAVKTDDGYEKGSEIVMPFDNVFLTYKIGKETIVRDLRTKSSDSLFEYDENGVVLKLTRMPKRVDGYVSFVQNGKIVRRVTLTDKEMDVDLSSLVV